MPGNPIRWTNLMLEPVSALGAFSVRHWREYLTYGAVEQRLQNIHFQLTDAVYSAVISGGLTKGSDVQQNLLSIMGDIYQTYLFICMYFFAI